MIKLIVLNILLTITCCQQRELNGNWILQKSDIITPNYYPEMQFKINGFVVLKSIGDTVYTGKYEINEKNIILKIGNENTTIQIHKFTNEKLVLSGFKNIKDTLTYLKKKQK